MVTSSRMTQALLVTNVFAVAWIAWREVGPALVRRIRTHLGKLLPQGKPGSLRRSLSGYLGQDYVPPLPKPVADALERSCLCFLATADATNEPHLSLMRFTYTAGLEAPNTEVMIISTRRNTKKYDIITRNQNVALLVHDFDTNASADVSNYLQMEGQSRYSITLNGKVQVHTGELAERYREIHLAYNRSYSQFIVGEDIAIITVNLERARVCDVNDRVRHFERADAGAGGSPAWTDVTSGGSLQGGG